MRKKDIEWCELLWKLAHARADLAWRQLYSNEQQHHNAWGSIYVSLEGDFGVYLRKVLETTKRKEIEVSIPHSDYRFLRAYADAFQGTLKEYDVDSRNDIAYN